MFILFYKSYPDSFLATMMSYLGSGILLISLIGICAGIYTLVTADSEEGLGILLTSAIGFGVCFLLKKGAKKVALRAVRKQAERVKRIQKNNNQQNG